MGFKLAQNPTFKTKIIVHTPNQKCGYDKSSFIAEFKRPETSKFEDLIQHNDVTGREYMRNELVGWEEMYSDDEMKDEVPFTPENAEALFQITEAMNALIDQYREAIKVAREKNFKR